MTSTLIASTTQALEPVVCDGKSLLDDLQKIVGIETEGTHFARMSTLRTFVCFGAAEYILKKGILAQRPFFVQSGRYFCDQQSASFHGLVEQAFVFLAEQGLTLPLLTVFDIAIAEKSAAWAVPFIPSKAAFIHIRVKKSADLLAVLVHELTHCSLLTGHLFIDEALAYYFESKLQQQNLLTSLVRNPRTHLLGLETLLRYNPSDDVFFNKLIPNNHLLVHAFGAHFIATVIARIGMPQTLALLRQLQAQPRKIAVTALVEHYCGCSLAVLELEMGLRPQSLEINYTTLTKDFIADNAQAVALSYQQFMQHRVSQRAHSQIQQATALALLLSVAMGKAITNTLSRLEIEHITAMFEAYEALDHHSAWYYLSRGLLYMLRALIEQQALESAMNFLEAEQDIALALSSGQDEPFIIAQIAKLTYHKLIHQQKDIQPVIDLYQQLEKNPQFTQTVQPILSRLMTEKGACYAA